MSFANLRDDDLEIADCTDKYSNRDLRCSRSLYGKHAICGMKSQAFKFTQTVKMHTSRISSSSF